MISKYSYSFVFLFLSILFFSDLSRAGLKLESYKNKKGNFIYEHDSLAFVSSINVVVLSGSIHDPKGKEGLANLAFDTLLRGTKKLSRNEFAANLEGLGATINSSTVFNQTLITLDTISENLEPAIQLLAEAILEPSLSEKDFQALKKETLAQLNQSRSRVAGVLFRAFREALYKNTPLASPPNGTVRSVSSCTISDVRNFLSQHIRNGNILIAVNTNVEPDRIKAWIEKSFHLTPVGERSEIPQWQTANLLGRELLILEKSGLTTVNTVMGHLSVNSKYQHLVELDVGNYIFGGGGSMSSRLFNVLRNDNGWTYGVSSSFNYLDVPRTYGGSFSVYTFPTSEHATKAITRMVEMYEDYIKNGVTQDELDFARNSLLNSYAFNFVSAADRVSGKLFEAIEGIPYYSYDEYKSILEKISPATLTKVLREAHDSENFILAVAGNPKNFMELKKTIPLIKSVKVVKDPIERLTH